MGKRKRLGRWLLHSLLMILMLNLSSVSADDHRRNIDHDEEESWLEEVGESLGWGTVILASAAGILLPARKMVKPVKANYPSAQPYLTRLIKGLAKNHVWIGIMAVAISLVHGVSLYLAEGELELRDWLGVSASGLMIAAGILGISMKMKKADMANKKKKHVHLFIVSGFFAVIHILVS